MVHQWSFVVAVVAGALLVALAPPDARLACTIYAFGLAGLLGTSALYHRVTWRRPRARAWMRRFDHAMIFILIAGTYTPFAALVLSDRLGEVVLAGVWVGAAAGIVFALVWVDAPKWLAAAAYVALGWFAIIAMPQIVDRAGLTALGLLLGGGLAYTAGAVVYARRRPDPRPSTWNSSWSWPHSSTSWPWPPSPSRTPTPARRRTGAGRS